MNQFRPSSFNVLPPVIKNLLIINGLMFLLTLVLEAKGIRLSQYLGLFPVQSPMFKPFQIVTHMFMHGGFWHIALNMFALWMFGSTLERIWGPQRFLFFYLTCGLGAAAILLGWNYYEIGQLKEAIALGGSDAGVSQELLQWKLRIPTVGASGAVYGVLIAFGVLFPNTLLYIYMLFPVKAKYLIAGLVAFELYMGLQNSVGDNVAHFAHLGGALFGFLLVLYWRKDRSNFY